jgi:DNA-binding transcriptional regulator YiaG
VNAIAIDLLEIDGNLVEASIRVGECELLPLAFVEWMEGEALLIRRPDLQGPGSNALGTGALLRLARLVKEALGVRQLRIEGAPRTSGAGPGRTPGRLPSETDVVLILRRVGAMNRRIDFVRRLCAEGLSLRGAHSTLTRLVDGGWATCSVCETTDLGVLARDLRDLDVEIRQRRGDLAGHEAIAAVRDRHGLSQREFADLLGFDVRTLQNWEQGRNRPDAAALTLIAMFDRAPEVVEELISEPIV